MSDKKLVAEFRGGGIGTWRLWNCTQSLAHNSGYFATLVDPATGIESEYAITRGDIAVLPRIGSPLHPATLWFLLAAGTQEQNLHRLARSRPEVIKDIHAQISLTDIIDTVEDGKTPLLRVVEANNHTVVPDLLAIGANPTK
jgi:hypothetical protein